MEKEFFPQLTRFKFELSASKEAAEVEDFKLLKQQSEDNVVEMKNAFKSYVVRATKIEMDVIHQKVRSQFITFSNNIDKVIAQELDPDIIICTIIQKHPELLTIMKTTTEKFNDEYKSIHKLLGDLQEYTETQQANPAQYSRTNTATISPYFGRQRPSPTVTADVSPTLSKMNFIGNALKIACIDPWKKYKAIHRENNLSIELNKIINTKLGEEANSVTEMELDSEATIDAPTIAELIAKKTTKATRSLTKEIETLNNNISQLKNSKKERRGQSPSSASEKTNCCKEGDLPRRKDTTIKRETKSSKKHQTTPKYKRKQKIRFYRKEWEKQVTLFQEEVTKEEQVLRDIHLNVLSSVRDNLQRNYGFIADPSKALRHNAFFRLQNMKVWQYVDQPHNKAFYNLTLDNEGQNDVRQLLGMGLTFIPNPFFTNNNLHESSRKSVRDMKLRAYYKGADTIKSKSKKDMKIYVRST